MSDGENILDLLDQLKNMPEEITLQKIRHFSISLEIFDNNYADLVHHLKIHNDSKTCFELMAVKNREMLHTYQREITRFLHNYIASALSLTDHARNHYDDLYGNNDLFPDYQNEIDSRFTKNPLAVFVKNLRHYFQHYRIPGVQSSLVVKNNISAEMKLLLTLQELNLYTGWKAPAKEFISAQKTDIDVIDLVNKYHDLITDFYRWYMTRTHSIHKNDIEVVKAHRNKIRGLEVSILLRKFAARPKTGEEFEEEMNRLFHDDDLEKIKKSTSPAVKIANILDLLRKTKPLQKEEIETITKLFPIK